MNTTNFTQLRADALTQITQSQPDADVDVFNEMIDHFIELNPDLIVTANELALILIQDLQKENQMWSHVRFADNDNATLLLTK